jgi:hypothetical protein
MIPGTHGCIGDNLWSSSASHGRLVQAHRQPRGRSREATSAASNNHASPLVLLVQPAGGSRPEESDRPAAAHQAAAGSNYKTILDEDLGESVLRLSEVSILRVQNAKFTSSVSKRSGCLRNRVAHRHDVALAAQFNRAVSCTFTEQ